MNLLFFLICYLYLLIPFYNSCNPIIELVISIGIPTKKVKAEIDIHPIASEARIRK